MSPVTLPASIQTILGDIAADQGRERAWTLLRILAAGPDWVQQNITAIHLALGPQSPGVPALERLVQLTRDAADPSSPKVEHQHFISQCLSGRFTEVINPKAGLQLISYTLKWRKAYPKGTGGVGYVDDFIKLDSEKTEAIWKNVEDHLPEAIDAAEDGTLFKSAALEKVIRDAIALHFVRNPQIEQIHQTSFGPAHQQGIERLAQTWASEEAFARDHGGLWPAGPEGRRMGAEAMLKRLSDRFNEGAMFRLRSQDLFEKMSDAFAATGLEILTPASTHSEFLLGDAPGLTVDLHLGLAGYGEFVGLAKATHVILPLDPKVLAVLGAGNGFRQISDDEVDLFNRLEARASKNHVFYRPSVDFKVAIDTWRAEAPPFSQGP